MPEGGVELATAYVTLKVDGRQVDPGVRRSLAGVDRYAGQAGKKGGKTFALGFGRVLGGAGAGLGIAAIGKQAVKLEKDFSKTMNLVAASTGAPKSQLESLSDLATKMGTKTAFSANEAAGAMLELGKAGVSANTIMGGGLQGTLLLATAGQTNLGVASTIASNAMNTFNLEGRDMASVASALAGGANASTASVESLGQALSQVGPGAKNAGLNLQQTVGVLAAFDNAGIKGSDAGTSLKTMLARLVPQTDKARKAMDKYGLSFVKPDGSFKSITAVAQQLQDRLGPLSAAQKTQALQTIFGSDATRAATVLMNEGADGLAKYIKATKDQTAAQKMADAAMDGTDGALKRLRSSVQTAQKSLGDVLKPTLNATADALSEDVMPKVTKFLDQMQSGKGAGGEFADTLGRVAGAGKEIAKGGGKVIGFFNDLPGPAKEASIWVGAAAVGLGQVKKIGAGLKGLKFGGAAAELGKGKAGPVPVFVTNPGFGAPGAGKPGAVVAATKLGRVAVAASKVTVSAATAYFGAQIGASIVDAIDDAVSDKLPNEKRTPFKQFDQQPKGLPGALLGKIPNTLKNDARDVLATKGGFGKLSFKGDKALSSLLNIPLPEAGPIKRIKELDATLASISKRNPAQGAADFNTVMTKTGLTSFELNKILPKTATAMDKTSASQENLRRMFGLVGDTAKVTAADLKSLPPSVQTLIEAPGAITTKKQVSALASQYDLTPKQVNTVMRALGISPTRANLALVYGDMTRLDKKKANPKVTADTSKARQQLNSFGQFLAEMTRPRTVHVNVAAPGNVTGPADLTRPRRRARGGPVWGPGGPRDDEVPIWASNGEFVVNAESYRRNRALVEAINANRYGGGGTVGGMSRVATAAGLGDVTLNVYDADNVLIGTMQAEADARYYANASLDGQG